MAYNNIFISFSSGGWIKVPVDLVIGEGSLLGLQMGIFSLCPHTVARESSDVSSSSSQGTNPTHEGSTFMLHLNLSPKASGSYAITLGVRTSAYGVRGPFEDSSVHNSTICCNRAFLR